jgi:hypothetical protein
MTVDIPDRLSVDPNSQFYNKDFLDRIPKIFFNGVQQTRVNLAYDSLQTLNSKGELTMDHYMFRVPPIAARSLKPNSLNEIRHTAMDTLAQARNHRALRSGRYQQIAYIYKLVEVVGVSPRFPSITTAWEWLRDIVRSDQERAEKERAAVLELQAAPHEAHLKNAERLEAQAREERRLAAIAGAALEREKAKQAA